MLIILEQTHTVCTRIGELWKKKSVCTRFWDLNKIISLYDVQWRYEQTDFYPKYVQNKSVLSVFITKNTRRMDSMELTQL